MRKCLSRRKFTPEQDAQLRAEYEAGASTQELADKWCEQRFTLVAGIRRAGGIVQWNRETTRRNLTAVHRLRRKFSPEQESDIVREYQQGASSSQLAKRHLCAKSLISRILMEADVTMRSGAEAITAEGRAIRAASGRLHRKYTLNEFYFSEIDTPAKARFLGFIAADGCVAQCAEKATSLIVTLKPEDRVHLECLKSAMGYTGPIHERLQTAGYAPDGLRKYPRLDISSIQMCSDLVRHGIMPAKSKTLQPWAGPSELMRFYFAGLVDGDGWVSKCGHDNSFLVGLCGTLPVIEAFAAFVEAQTGFHGKVCPDRVEGVYRCVFAALRPAQAAARLFYTDLQGSIPLASKQATANLILAAAPKVKNWSWLTSDAIEAIHAKHGNWNDVAAELGIGVPQLCYLRKIRGMGKRPDWSHLTGDAFLEVYNRVGTWNAAAAELGIPLGSLSCLRRRLGLLHPSEPHP